MKLIKNLKFVFENIKRIGRWVSRNNFGHVSVVTFPSGKDTVQLPPDSLKGYTTYLIVCLLPTYLPVKIWSNKRKETLRHSNRIVDASQISNFLLSKSNHYVNIFSSQSD